MDFTPPFYGVEALTFRSTFQRVSVSAFAPSTFPFQLSTTRRIITRLYVMGGTIAEPSVGQVSLSGRAALLRTTQTTPRSH